MSVRARVTVPPRARNATELPVGQKMCAMYMPHLHYPSVASARDNIKLILDAAERGQAVTIERSARRSAVVDAERLRGYFLTPFGSTAEAVHEEGGRVITTPGRPIAAEVAFMRARSTR